MSKLTKLLAQAALVAVAGTWGTSLAHADITYSLQLDGAATPTFTTNMSGTGGSVVLDLVANISAGANGANSGLFSSMGNFVATYTGSDAGAVSGVTIGSAFSSRSGFSLSQTGTAMTGGSGNWGDITSSGAGNSFVVYTSNIALDTHTVVAQGPTDAFGNIVLGQLTYTVSQITPGQTISLAYVPRDPAGGASSVWVEDNGTTTTYKSNKVVSDSQGDSTVAGTAAYTPFVVTAASGPTQFSGTDGANWGAAGAWTSGMPGTTGTALFQDHVPATLTAGINLEANHTIDTVNFNSAHSGMISSGAGAQLTVTSAITMNNGTSHTISADISLGGNVAVSLGTNANPAATLNVGNLDTNGHKLTIGSGATVLVDAIGGLGILSNATGTIVNNGNLTVKSTLLPHNLGTVGTVAAPNSSTSNLTVEAGASASMDNMNGGKLTVNGNLTLTGFTGDRSIGSYNATAPTGLAIVVNGLSLGTSGLLDIGDRDVIVKGGAAHLSDVQTWIAEGYSGNGDWSGTLGITSNAAFTNNLNVNSTGSGYLTGIGYATVDELGIDGGMFDGVPVSNGDLILKYTYVGDGDLSGNVDITDLLNILNGYGNDSTTGSNDWYFGDTDYSQNVDITDLLAMLNTYGSGDGSVAGGNPMLKGFGPVSVPEPASLGLLGLGALAILRSRRK